ncbi:MAG: hypothetical protein IPO83_18440 [Chitinophagaceae bacterium]|nr:hypothetical protein [Chitinophagaceae bacterium]
MTTTYSRSLQALAILSVTIMLFSGCLKDTCTNVYSYKLYKPIYMGFDVLRSAVKSLPAEDLKSTGKIYYKAPYIFISEVDKGIHIIDNTDPASPQNISFINIPGCIDIAVKDNILYADSYIDLVAIDIKDPLNVKEVSRTMNVFPNRTYTNGWSFDPANGVITGWTETDTTVEQNCGQYYPIKAFEDVFVASTTSGGGATSNTAVSPGNGIAGSMARFAIYDQYLYCLDYAAMKMFDISTAAKPVSGSTVTMPWNIETIFPYDHYLFIGSTTGVSIYDNANPSSPSFVSQLSHVSSCDPVVVQGNYAYATLRDGNSCQGFSNELDVIDISNIYNPVLKTTVPFNHPFGLGIDQEHLFICDDASGLKSLDATDPLAITLSETITAGATRDVIPLGNLLLLISTDGLYQFDYSSGSLVQLSYLPISK